MPTQNFQIRVPDTTTQIEAVRELFASYAASLKVDLCLQNFEAEMAELPGLYAPPQGSLLAAYAGDQLAGCCALRPLDIADYPDACEIKRLYVRQAFRGFGAGRQLVEAILDTARQANYACALLDTLSEMTPARSLYKDMGFIEIEPYYVNPIKDAHYFMLRLKPATCRK